MIRGIYLLLFCSILFSCSKNTTESSTQVAKILPISPSNLKATSLSITEINLTWIDNSTNEDGFKIERKEGTSDFKVIATIGIDKTDYKDSLLTPYVQYTYRVYAFNTLGKSVTYSNIDSAGTYGVPLVNTKQIDSVTSIDAVSGGIINNNGGAPILEKGIIWSKVNSPSLNLTTKVKNISDTVNYKSVLYSLEPNTTYYLWAYATNKFGTSFGNMITFKTTPFIFKEVTSKTGRIWMDRNLGATRVAESLTDEKSYGFLYQWGRLSDGHQYRTSTTTDMPSKSNIPNHSQFILLTPISSQDWRMPSNDSLWQGAESINNACPTGFRVPTKSEWEEEIKTWSSQNSSGAINSVLKLPYAGRRANQVGTFDAFSGTGSTGNYWSSTPIYVYYSFYGTSAYYLSFYNNVLNLEFLNRNFGLSVRCIKN
jgi:uncharacterized protein (TIGR02145 family)